MSRFVARWQRLLPYVLILAIASLLFHLAISPAAAQEWKVNKAKSSVSLQLSVDGQPVAARFGRYKFDIRFDPEEAADGEIVAAIDAASLSTGDAARDAVLYGPEWLNAGAYPAIKLSSVKIREKAAPDYRLDADLTLRGVTKRVTVPLMVDDAGDAGKIYAQIPFNPAAFGISPASGEMQLVLDLTAVHLTN
jgi:polyisoprenoid-binding protein YceI